MRKLAEVSKFQTKCGGVINRYLAEMGKQSLNTEKNIRGDINRFTREMFGGKSIDTITVEELETVDYDLIMDYRESMYEVLANATINRHLNSIKEVVRELKARNLLESDISYFTTIKKLPTKTVSIDYMPFEVVDEYVNEAGKQMNHAKLKQNMIKFAADTGLRLDEVLTIELKQFTIDGDSVIMKGYGKGNKEYIDRIDIELYNDLLETMTTEDNPTKRLFSPLNTKNVTDMMTKIKNDLGYEDRAFSFHSFKKTAVTNTYRLTGCILAAQRKGRHSDLNTTRKYLQDEDFGITGMFSLRNRKYDEELYKKVSPEILLETIGKMNKDFVYLLNLKLNSLQKQSNTLQDI